MSESQLRAIDPKPFMIEGRRFDCEPGARPEIGWLDIEELGVDSRYQREIMQRGRANIFAIAEQFRWSRFGPVIVAAKKGRLYPIIDGQHRTTAAALVGFRKVPCHIVEADIAEQAAAFRAINGNITQITPTQLFHAGLAAGEPSAIKLQAVCDASEVKIARYPKKQADMQKGETLACGALAAMLKQHGAEILTAALRCITRTGGGNPGWVRPQLIRALCAVFAENPRWAKSPRRLSALEKAGIPALFEKSKRISVASQTSHREVLRGSIVLILRDEFGVSE